MSFKEEKFRRPTSEVLRIGREFQNSDKFHGCTYETAKMLCDEIECLAGKPRCGHWYFINYALVGCSVCGNVVIIDFEVTKEANSRLNGLYPYCPHCGAKMEYTEPYER